MKEIAYPAIAPDPSGGSMIVRFDLDAEAAASSGAWRGGSLEDGRTLILLLPIVEIPEWRERFAADAQFLMLLLGAGGDVTLETSALRPEIRGGSPLALRREEVSAGAFVDDDDEYPSDDEAADDLITADGYALGGPVWRHEPAESRTAFLLQLNGDAAWGLPTGDTYYVLTNRIEKQFP